MINDTFIIQCEKNSNTFLIKIYYMNNFINVSIEIELFL